MDINASTLRSIYTGLSTAFNARFSTVQTYYNTVAMTVPSTTAMNEYPRLDDLPGFREWLGDRVIHDLGAQTYIIRNKTFEKTISIKREQIEDDQLGIFAPVSSQMGQDAAEFPDHLCWPLMNKGETLKCYDGQYFFDTDHPGYDESGKRVSVSNFTAGSGPAWYLVDDSQVMKPLVYQTRRPFALTPLQSPDDPNVFFKGKFIWGVDGRSNSGLGLWQLAHKSKAVLNEANFMAALTAMTTMHRRDGSILKIRPTKLLVPSALELTALKLIKAELTGGGDTNVLSKMVEVISVPYLI
jgi:phage major head subunit gpT-like protein